MNIMSRKLKEKNKTLTKTPSKKEMRQKRTVRQIIDATEILFREKGFEQTTMDDIADRALFSKTTIYKYFNRKEDLYLALAIRAYRKLLQMLSEELDGEQSGLEQAISVGKTYFKFAQKYPIYRKSFDLSENVEIYNLDPIIKRKPSRLHLSESLIDELRQLQQNFMKFWVNIIALGQKDGSITPKYPPHLIAFSLATITTGLVDELIQREKIIEGMNTTSKNIFDLSMDFLLNGIINKESNK